MKNTPEPFDSSASLDVIAKNVEKQQQQAQSLIDENMQKLKQFKGFEQAEQLGTQVGEMLDKIQQQLEQDIGKINQQLTQSASNTNNQE
ncbi:hypothetical protein [Celerinatantimonas sp. YJH-8]|uniref:hypothetical protein n=1 Tax=Celerinatantimonas sp. YJH-8 TaxID=3228714 RepID=UPI0038C6966D